MTPKELVDLMDEQPVGTYCITSMKDAGKVQASIVKMANGRWQYIDHTGTIGHLGWAEWMLLGEGATWAFS